jgi:hypothetical protein
LLLEGAAAAEFAAMWMLVLKLSPQANQILIAKAFGVRHIFALAGNQDSNLVFPE